MNECEKTTIVNLCSLIFVYEEDLLVSGKDLNSSTRAFIDKNFAVFNDIANNNIPEDELIAIICEQHKRYCTAWDNTKVAPYAFLEHFDEYRGKFREYWIKDGKSFPSLLDFMFDKINSLGEEFILIKSYVTGYITKSMSNLKNDIEKEISDVTKTTQNAVRKIQSKSDKTINQFNEKIDNAEKNLSNKLAETSVTVLGIFSGIAITIVAGLTFSASVLQNINSTSIYRLIIVSSIIGFVCFNMIGVMFHFIDKYRASPTKTKNNKNNKSSNTLFGFLYARLSQNFYLSVINIFLCLVMIFTFICWQLGVVESRNEKLHDTNSEFVITTIANHFQVYR